MAIEKLPLTEKQELKLGFMRLTDAAPLVLARELGFFQELGLEVELVREISWANLRDRLALGDLDAAQMLSPLPMMATYGVGGVRANIITGMSLSLNGNAITLSNHLAARLQLQADDLPVDPLQISDQLKKLIEQENRTPALTLATPNLFSMHTILLRMWLQASGINPDHDVRIIVLPPAQMCDSLARGIIDGFCVGEPWNSMAVTQGSGTVVSSGYQIWNNSPEKVLGVTEGWHQDNPGSHLRLRLALMKACRCLSEWGYREQALTFLSRPEYLNLPEKILAPSLLGDFRFTKGQEPVAMKDFHVFWNYQACFPWRSSAETILKLLAFSLARPIDHDQVKNLVQRCYRTDLYRDAARYFGVPSPSKDYKKEGVHEDSWQFEKDVMLGADMVIDPSFL